MAVDVSQQILRREVSRSKPSTNYRQLYSTRRFIDDLDIVNELDGHSGCVNALSWSKSGRLLASGSDDRHLNIHAYQPDNSTKQFQLRTTVATGHSQNIFSVKFMPHSNDNTVVTCGGEGDVRVFDLEYTGQANNASSAASIASASRRRGRGSVFADTKYMTDGDTNARVYRSHADRVKRVVTEDSPFLFLTCSEDGEVRQWDTRQPSSYYPRPRGDVYVPPPLISYRRFHVDLNTISCSGAQPYYIALGGTHINCFLHDRRMAGRSRVEESGRPSSAPRSGSSIDDAMMAEATRCVRRFSPDGNPEVKPNERGHITACKISDARPNEIVVSWSHDHIYKFDMIRSPDGDKDSASRSPEQTRSVKKRKLHGQVRSRREPEESALRIHYANGQQEDVTIRTDEPTEEQKAARRITKTVLSLCRNMFNYSIREMPHDRRFTRALGEAAAILDDIDEVSRSHGYPVDPTPIQVASQKRCKQIREKTRRFVQTAGCLARLLGGKLQTAGGDSPQLAQFIAVQTRSNDRDLPQDEQFAYDFIKAVVLWLDSGPGALIDGFTRPSNMAVSNKAALRLPIPADMAAIESIHEHLLPYFTRLAADALVIDLDSNPFQAIEHRQVYSQHTHAVTDLFANVRTPFTDLITYSDLEKAASPLDRREMRQKWAYTVARSLLWQAFLPMDFTELDVAFGGDGDLPENLRQQAAGLNEVDQDSEDHMMADPIAEVEHVNHSPFMGAEVHVDPISPGWQESHTPASSPADEIEVYFSDEMGEEEHEDEEDDDSSEPDEVDGVPSSGYYGYMSARQREQQRSRSTLGSGVPCVGPLLSYSGHCNVRTVKDVNYYGLDDEYIISGSDDGNFFIWESKTGKLVNILEGDGEVVNVMQGHPYEPLLAVSGIDHTIKIFSPDHRARTVARLGEEVSAHDPSTFSSLAWPHRPMRRRAATTEEDCDIEADAADIDDDSFIGAQGLRSRQRMNMRQAITSMNEKSMRRGDEDNMITSSYLRLVARYLRAQRAAQANPDIAAELDHPGVDVEEDEDGQTRIIVNDDCVVM